MSFYNYKVLYKKNAEKFLKSNKREGIKFYKAFKELTENKEDVKRYDIKKYHCENDYTYRLKIGSNRAIFEVYEDSIVILIHNIGSRGDIYKKY